MRVMRLDALKPAPYNPRTISEEAFNGLTESVRRFGLVQPIILNKRTGYVIGGHQRIHALRKLGARDAQVIVVDLTEEEERALNVTLNNPHIAGEWSDDIASLLDQIKSDGIVDFEGIGLQSLLDQLTFSLNDGASMSPGEARKTLAERFGIPPFSVFDARQGYWQERKRAWIALGITSELGRGENLLSLSAACNLQQKGKDYK